MSGDGRRHGGPSSDDEPGDDQPDWESDRDDTHDEIPLYALGIYAFAFLFVVPLMNDFIQAHFGRWVVVVAGFALLVGWGVALAGLVLGRRWGWVGSLCFHGFGVLLALVTGNVLFVLVLLLTGFYVLSKGLLYLDDGTSGTTAE